MGARPLRRRVLLAVLALVGITVPAVQAGESPPTRDSSTEAEARLELGRLYHEQVFQSLDRAIAEYEGVVRARPDLAEARYYLALGYHTRGKLNGDDGGLYRRALAEYREYLRLDPRGELASAARRNIAAIEARLNPGGSKGSPGASPARGRTSPRRRP